MLYRYANYVGMNTEVTGEITGYDDSGDVSTWASDAMRWAVATGIISGRDENTLAPGGEANRAEVATMIERFVNLMVK